MRKRYVGFVADLSVPGCLGADWERDGETENESHFAGWF